MTNELTFDEILTARSCFAKHTEDKIVNVHQLRCVLGDLGQYPSLGEMETVLDFFDSKITFDEFCVYLTWLKKIFLKPEPKDVDTVRAFVALGGKQDRGGDINADDLRSTCRRFDLTIDIDAMLREVDEDGSGTIEYNEFRSMWETDEGSTMRSYAEEDTQSEKDYFQALRDYLAAKAKEQSGQGAVTRQQSMIKRKQSTRGAEQRKSMVRLPQAVSSLAFSTKSRSKSINDGVTAPLAEQQADDGDDGDDGDAAAEEEQTQKPKERQNPNLSDPIYRRYLMTDPIVVGQKKGTARTPALASTTPRSARSSSPHATPRKAAPAVSA